MNKERVLELAGLIESLPERQVDMCDLVTSCGTPSCIAGWAAWLEQGKPEVLEDNGVSFLNGNSIVESALDFLEIGRDERKYVVDKLFRGDYGDRENSELWKEDVVKCLRHFASTGRVSWPSLADEEDK